ncbi:hypothetical protein Theco_0260, partial [Calderihabitans maritimus]
QVLSHETIRQILLEVAASVEREDEKQIIKGTEKRTVDALFIEVDGFNTHMQSRQRGKRKRRETK